MNKFLKFLQKLSLHFLDYGAWSHLLLAIYDVSLYFPFYISEGEEMPYHRMVALRVTILLTFAFYSLKYLISESRQLYPIQFLDTILKTYFFSALVIGIRFDVAKVNTWYYFFFCLWLSFHILSQGLN
jgi:hypothetical protein